MKTLIYTIAICMSCFQVAYSQTNRIKATSEYFFNPSTFQNELLDSSSLHYTGSKSSAFINAFVPSILDIHEEYFMADNDSSTKNFTNPFATVRESVINTYNTNGKLVKKEYKSFDASTNVWSTTSIKYIVYLSNGKYNYIITERPDFMQTGMDSTKLIVVYTGNNITEITEQLKISGATVWENQYRYSITYDNNNNEKTVLEQQYNNGTSTFENQILDVVFYNANQQLEKDSNYVYNDSIGAWVVGGVSTIAYNAGVKQSITTISFEDNMVDSFKQNFTTNANGDITKQTASQNFGGQWLPFFTINFYYEPVPTQAPSKINPLASNINIDLFPNPANAVLQLSIKTPKAVDCKVIITDVLGKQISAENLSANQLNLPNQINITSLQVGTYLLSIIMPNGEVVSKKFNKI